jgi:hypothetical protein
MDLHPYNIVCHDTMDEHKHKTLVILVFFVMTMHRVNIYLFFFWKFYHSIQVSDLKKKNQHKHN